MTLPLALLLLVVGPPSADAKAESQAIARAEAIIDGGQTANSRKCLEVVAASASGFVAPYSVELFAEFNQWVDTASIVDVERTATGVVVRRFDASGTREATLTASQARQLDEWARTSLALHRATSRETGCSLILMGSYATHRESRTLTLRAAGKVQLETAPTQALAESLGGSLPDFTATWSILELEGLARTWLDGVPAKDGPPAAAMTRLKRLPKKAVGRHAIEARLLAQQLARSNHRPAVALLRRRGHAAQALQLSLSTTPLPDLAAAVTPLMCSADFVTRYTAAENLSRLGQDARGPLIRAVGCAGDDWMQVRLLDQLVALGSDPATERALDAAAAPSASEALQVAARAHRFAVKADKADLEFLVRTATGPAGPLQTMGGAQRAAVSALTKIASDTPREAPKIAAVFVGMVGRIPADAPAITSGLSHLVAALAPLGGVAHDATFRRVLGYDDASGVDAAVHAIASYDLRAAVRIARERVRQYNDGSGTKASYAWNVFTYLDLFLRTDDVGAVLLLDEALVLYLRETGKPDPWHEHTHRAALKFLRAEKEASKAAAAVEYITARGRPTPELRSYLMDRFAGIDAKTIEAGAKQHEVLLQGWQR